MLRDFQEDIKRYFTPEEIETKITKWKAFKKVLQQETLWAIFIYRYGRWLYSSFNVPILKSIMRIFYASISRILEMLLGIHINLGADIGKGLYIGHYGGIWVGPIKMGECCSLSQEVTIGIGGAGENRGIPQLGEKVWIGPGAKIFGAIKIGSCVAIGANAVVSKNIPNNAVVVGNPARIVSFEGSSQLLNLHDNAGLWSLKTR